MSFSWCFDRTWGRCSVDTKRPKHPYVTLPGAIYRYIAVTVRLLHYLKYAYRMFCWTAHIPPSRFQIEQNHAATLWPTATFMSDRMMTVQRLLIEPTRWPRTKSSLTDSQPPLPVSVSGQQRKACTEWEKKRMDDQTIINGVRCEIVVCDTPISIFNMDRGERLRSIRDGLGFTWSVECANQCWGRVMREKRR